MLAVGSLSEWGGMRECSSANATGDANWANGSYADKPAIQILRVLLN
jgi:hypothetical protein